MEKFSFLQNYGFKFEFLSLKNSKEERIMGTNNIFGGIIMFDFDYEIKRTKVRWKTKQVLYFIFVPLLFILGGIFIIFRGNLVGQIYDLLAGVMCLIVVVLSPSFYFYERSNYRKKIQSLLKAKNGWFNSGKGILDEKKI